jgi:cytochrome c-type biogenesis protein CcmF
VLVGTAGLVVLRLPAGDDRERLGPRGRAFLLNNLLLTAVAGTILFGTVFPLLAEAFADTRVSVGAPYFERVIGPLAVGLLVLLGIGPTLPWGAWSPESRWSLIPGAGSAAVAAGVLLALRAEPAAVAGAAAGVFALVQSSATLAGRVARVDPSRMRARVRLRATTTRNVGGLMSHVGVGLLALAVVASAAGKGETIVSLRTGETADVLGQSVTYLGTGERPGPNRTVIAARVRLGDGSSEVSPALNVFPTSTQAIATPAIVPGLVTDLYVTLLDVDPAAGVATLRIGTHPLVSWIWPAGGLIALGGVLALAALPLGRRSRSNATEHQPAVGSESALDVIRR